MKQNTFESTEGMTPACKEGLRNLLLACADTKLLLGYHYGEWTFGPPEIEAAIACCSLCQTELGHVRLLHGLLNKHYGDDADALVETRKPGEFANITFLDNEMKSWAELVAANYVVDLAVTTLLHAMKDSTFQPLHMSLDKMLQEEKFHVHHGQGWFRTLAGKSEETRTELSEAASDAVRRVVEWFGPADADEDRALVEAGVKSASNAEIVGQLLEAVGRFAQELKVDAGLEKKGSSGWQVATQPDWRQWRARTRRVSESGPDERILYHLRGSKNQVFKLST